MDQVRALVTDQDVPVERSLEVLEVAREVDRVTALDRVDLGETGV
jgi:hypothetical protein